MEAIGGGWEEGEQRRWTQGCIGDGSGLEEIEVALVGKEHGRVLEEIEAALAGEERARGEADAGTSRVVQEADE